MTKKKFLILSEFVCVWKGFALRSLLTNPCLYSCYELEKKIKVFEITEYDSNLKEWKHPMEICHWSPTVNTITQNDLSQLK